MADARELEAAVLSFQQAEGAIKALFDEISSLVTVSTKFEEARQGLVAASSEIASSALTHGELSKRLAELSKNLADATEVVRKIDPARLYSELEKIRQDFQAQIERLGTLGGDLKTRIESSGEKVSAKVVEFAAELEDSIDTTRRRVDRWSLLLVFLGVATISMQVALLISG